MKLILTSDFPSTENTVVSVRMRSVASRPKIAWIPPFTDVGRKRFVQAQERFQRFGFDQLVYCDIDLEADESQWSHFDRYDVIYLSGGDPIRFRTNILRSGLAARLQKCLDEGRLLVAASGGALQFTANLSLFRLQAATVEEVIADRREYRALGFVGYELLPHLNSFEDEFLDKVRAYSQRVDHDIIAIHDGSAILHSDVDHYRCVGQAVRFHNGVMTLT